MVPSAKGIAHAISSSLLPTEDAAHVGPLSQVRTSHPLLVYFCPPCPGILNICLSKVTMQNPQDN